MSADLYMKVRRLPTQIERTEAKLARLYAEARDAGLRNLPTRFVPAEEMAV
jgi:hypothetical protein